ncbi:MAG: hypothetical protein EBR40_00120 [Proteobacteria bacterium]|nr:hypothetical protein [Pseudomonadota bacterium]
MCGGLSNNDNSPLFWALLQIKQLPSAIAKVLGDNVEAMREINQGKKVALLQIIASRLFAAVIHAILVLALALGAFVIITKKQEARLGTLVENSRSLLQTQKQLAADMATYKDDQSELGQGVKTMSTQVNSAAKAAKDEILAARDASLKDIEKGAQDYRTIANLLKYSGAGVTINSQGELVLKTYKWGYEIVDDPTQNGAVTIILHK